MEAADRTFEDIKVGDSASFSRTFSEADIRAFAKLSGDENPLHVDPAYAATTQFKKPLVHGMLAASLFSTLVGMHLPGKRCLYLSQTLTFRKPVFAGDELTVTGTVAEKYDALHLVELTMLIECAGERVVDGVARVQVLDI